MSFFASAAEQHPPSMVKNDKIELIWQMGSTSLHETDNELRLPTAVSESLSREEIGILESLLSDHLNGAPVISFKDLSMNIYRILRMPEMHSAASSPATTMSPVASSPPISSPVPKHDAASTKARTYGKKSKIPRPANAFILYRQKHHPLLKAENSDLHNNEISVILGQQWKNESSAVRDKFKALAEELKRQHQIKFPEYQYAPRKPSEKKRRMTAKKLAHLQNLEAGQDSSEFPASDTSGIEQHGCQAGMSIHDSALQARLENVPSLERILGLDGQNNLPSIAFPSAAEMADELDNIFTPPTHATGYSPAAAAVYNTNPAAFANNTAFLNSIVDWDSVQDELEQFQQYIGGSELKDAASLKDASGGLIGMSQNEQDAFQDELDEALQIL